MTPALGALLTDLPDLVSVDRIDGAWVFPPRVLGDVESGLVVLSLWPEGRPDSDDREVVTVRYEEGSGSKEAGRVREVVSRGWAPSSRLQRLIDGVVRRVGEANEEPQTGSIRGEADGWNRFVAEVSDGTVDLPNGE